MAPEAKKALRHKEGSQFIAASGLALSTHFAMLLWKPVLLLGAKVLMHLS